MFKQIFYVQWRATLPLLALLVVGAFALPLLSVQGITASDDPARYAYNLLAMERLWLPAYPVLAMSTGALLGTFVWAWDHRHHHVYALSLPVTRARYALLKMAAGALLLIGPALALGVGGVLAGFAIPVPEPLQAYPGGLALRFGLTSLLCYSLFCALASSSIRVVVIGVVTVVVALALSGPIVSIIAATAAPEAAGFSLTRAVFRWLLASPGPFSILDGNWMLFDV